jgi:hypothetical protein
MNIKTMSAATAYAALEASYHNGLDFELSSALLDRVVAAPVASDADAMAKAMLLRADISAGDRETVANQLAALVPTGSRADSRPSG